MCVSDQKGMNSVYLKHSDWADCLLCAASRANIVYKTVECFCEQMYVSIQFFSSKLIVCLCVCNVHVQYKILTNKMLLKTLLSRFCYDPKVSNLKLDEEYETIICLVFPSFIATTKAEAHRA